MTLFLKEIIKKVFKMEITVLEHENQKEKPKSLPIAMDFSMVLLKLVLESSKSAILKCPE